MRVAELLVKMRLVIEAIYVDGAGIGLESGPWIVVSRSHKAGGIFTVADVGEHLGYPPAGGVALLPAFVAYGPQNHRRVIAVAVNHRHQVLFGPFVEEGGIAVGLFGIGPGVGKFVHYQEAHTVAEVEQLRCGRIMAAADGIAAHGAKPLQAPYPGVVVPGGSERAGVVMQAHALEEGAEAVKVETVGLPFGLPDSE